MGDQPAELAASDVTLGLGYSRCTLQGLLQGPLELSVTGAVHVQNALGAALAALALGYPDSAIRAGLRAFTGVPGRFELVSRDPLAVVDYAHTPDGLRGTLATARALVQGRILLVFGCGGERDQGKRPEMGQLADAGADLVVLTTDNPRREDPAAIAAMVRAGAGAPRARWIEEPDRRAAIALALSEARPGDLVLVAGKGHEETQEVGGQTLAFSDRACVLSLLDNLK
jgi:UDP-N-acetylmuramyl-tripeptide synthetase